MTSSLLACAHPVAAPRHNAVLAVRSTSDQLHALFTPRHRRHGVDHEVIDKTTPQRYKSGWPAGAGPCVLKAFELTLPAASCAAPAGLICRPAQTIANGSTSRDSQARFAASGQEFACKPRFRARGGPLRRGSLEPGRGSLVGTNRPCGLYVVFVDRVPLQPRSVPAGRRRSYRTRNGRKEAWRARCKRLPPTTTTWPPCSGHIPPSHHPRATSAATSPHPTPGEQPISRQPQ